MPVFSYLAYPEKGQKAALEKALLALPHCEVMPADNADLLLLVTDTPDEVLMEREVSLRLLRHIASSVRHQQFHDSDIVTVRVEVPEAERGR